MTKGILIFVICIVLNGCRFQSENSSMGNNTIKTNTVNLDTTYINAPLLRCLSSYISSYDTVQNSWKLPPIYTIRFYKNGRDTLVYISGHKIRPVIVNNNLKLIGFFFIQDKPILIIDNCNSLGSRLYKVDKLLNNIELVDKGRDRYRFETRTLPTWVYELHDQSSLILIEKREGLIMK